VMTKNSFPRRSRRRGQRMDRRPAYPGGRGDSRVTRRRTGATVAGMLTILEAALGALLAALRPRGSLVAENLLFRQQLAILRRTTPRLRLRPIDRAFWVVVSRLWSRWADTLAIVHQATVIGRRKRRWKRSPCSRRRRRRRHAGPSLRISQEGIEERTASSTLRQRHSSGARANRGALEEALRGPTSGANPEGVGDDMLGYELVVSEIRVAA
jgi:hypothetical protein